MADRSIRIRVGAALDANTSAVFRPLIDAARKARASIDADMNRAGKSARALGPAAKSGASAAERAFEDLERQVKGLPSPLDKAGGAARKFGKDAETSFSLARDRFDALAKDAAKNAIDIERSMARAGAARAKALRQFGGSVMRGGQVGLRVARGAIGAGARLAGDVLAGAGVNFDLGAGIAQNVDLEKRAVDLSNAGYMPGDVHNGERVNKRDLMQQARDVGMDTAFDPTQALEGLQAFVGKTGDLATGRDILKDMAILSKATGTELRDMVDAAGDAANQLGDMPNKGEALVTIMRGIAGQGKLGAVEIKDMAKQMAKVAAAASQFEGSSKDNILLMGAFAQEARQRGGSASATQAATSVGSFINTFSKGARLKAFESFGVKTQGAGGLRNAQAIVVDAMNAAMRHGGQKMFSKNMGEMFMDVRARGATRGFENIYQRAYNESKGSETERLAAATAAVNAEFERLKDVAMSQAEVQESFNRAMDTTESRVQIFNNQMAAAATQLQEVLMPALVEFGAALPDILKGLGKVIDLIPGANDIKSQAESRQGARKSLADTNVMSHAMHALGAGNAAETEQIYDSATGTWHQRGREIDARLPGAVGEQVSETERALEEAKAKERAMRAEKGTPSFYDDEKLKGMAMYGNEDAQGILNQEAQVKALEQKLEEAKTVQGALLEAVRSGTLQVKVMNPQDLAPTRRVTADMSGRAPAESPTDND